MWHSATHGVANISGNMIPVSCRPGPAPISVNGNITNDFIRSRTKPAFSIRHSPCFTGMQRNCESLGLEGRSVWRGRVIPFGCLSLLALGILVCPLWDPDKAVTHQQGFALSACRATSAHTQRWVPSLGTLLVQQLHGMLPETDNRIKSRCGHGLRLFVSPWSVNSYCWGTATLAEVCSPIPVTAPQPGALPIKAWAWTSLNGAITRMSSFTPLIS